MTEAQRRERIRAVMVITTLITGERTIRYNGVHREYVDPDSEKFGFAIKYFDALQEALQSYLDVVELETLRDWALIVVRNGGQL
jgi:hypothetical protein